ncbi:MAG: sarcosine dehydrogenase [Pelagibacteraceae bacterium]|nr:sarcosine dehydrogenase [Pelagibacteraceae bacterium]|tara:strand:+ start:53731 stop:56172 length:2442 start_codon:yes stop_codon:yes gene_type:complete
MNNIPPKSAKVVVIGGGVAGCSVAYHLTEFGWKDVVLLERDQLTSGTTWHAAGLIGQLGSSATITRLRNYSLNLYKRLEKETGLSTGLKQNGSLTVATTNARLEELKRQLTFAQRFNVEAKEVTKEEIKEIYPLINTQDVVGGVFISQDGQADPVGVTSVLAKSAKKNGAQFFEKCPVRKILVKNGKIQGIETDYGKIECEYIVLATGMWSRQVAAEVGVSIPLYPNEHFYILSEPMNEIQNSLPVLRDYNNCLYLKEDAGKLLVGLFEPNARPAFTNTYKVPDDFSFGELPEDFDHFEPYLQKAMNRIPSLEKVGIRKFFNGPESFTPDTNYLLGETPEVKNFFVCCGFNSIGIVSSGGAGKVTAEWMINGEVNDDLFSLDITRFEKFHSETKFITERVTETLGNLYAMHWPYKQLKTSRNQKLLPFHDDLKNKGACFGQVAGFERPMWYALNGNKPEYEYSYGYQNWYESAKYETINTRKNVGLFDLTAFAKFEIKGKSAFEDLQRLCCNNIKNDNGKTTYTQMLNSNGGIVADITVTCIKENIFRIVTGSSVREHDKKHIIKNLSDDTTLLDITEDLACLGIFGPKSRELLSDVFGEHFSTNDFKFGNAKEIKFNKSNIIFQRLSFVGELGWEIYIPIGISRDVYLELVKHGKNYDLIHAGGHALDIMRMEKGYLHWGHDITPAENPYEAGLGFVVNLKKEYDFIGKNYLLKNKNTKIKQFVKLILSVSKPGNPLLLHDEPIYLNNKIVGETTSGNFSFIYNKNMAFGYIDSKINLDKNKTFEIEVAKKRYEAFVLDKPLHDPNNILLKS